MREKIIRPVIKVNGLASSITQDPLHRFCTDAEKDLWNAVGGGGGGDMLKSENLSGLADYPTARGNLGLGSLATQSGTFSGTSSGTNTGDQDLSGKQDALVSGTNIKTVNSQSLLGSGNLTVSASITETEIDVGTTPVAEASIAVTDAAVTTSSKIIGGIAYKAPTGKDLDELEMDAIDLKFEPGTGTFNVHIKGLEGYIADKFIIWYQVAA